MSAVLPLAGTQWDNWVGEFRSAHVTHLADWRGYSEDFCRALHAARLVGKLGGRIAFPIVGKDGVVHGCQNRSFAADKSGWKTDWFDDEREFLPLVIAGNEKPSVAVAFESQWDLFAFLDKTGWHINRAAGNLLFFATRGAAGWKRATEISGEVESLLLVPQNDSPGQRWATDIALSAKCEVRSLVVPREFKDLNDWTRAGATEPDLQKAIETSIDLKRQVAESTPQPEGTGIGYDWEQPAKPLPDGRVMIALPGENRLLSEFGNSLGLALKNADLFQRDGRVFLIDSTRGCLKPVSADNFRTWIEQYVVGIRLVGRGEKKVARHSLDKWSAASILVADSFLKHLRPIVGLNPVPIPVFRENGKLELLPVGYDDVTQTFTIQPAGVSIKPVGLEEAKQVLDDILGEFCFPREDEGLSRAVAIAAMLTPFVRLLISSKAVIPAFLFAANAEGAGKTLLALVVMVPMMGNCPVSPKPESDDEIRKRLLCATINSEATILFDNVKDHFSSAALEAFLTSHMWSDRILGASKMFCGEKRTTVFITANSCTMSPDLRRRFLVSELFLEESRPEQRVFRRNLDAKYLLEHRSEILSALMGLVVAWDDAGRPKPSQSNASFPEWASVVGGIVEHAGYKCPVQAGGTHQLPDRDLMDMERLLKSLRSPEGQKAYSFMEIASQAHRQGLFEMLFAEDGTLDRRGKSVFGKLLRRYTGRKLSGVTLQIREGEREKKYVVIGKCLPEELA